MESSHGTLIVFKNALKSSIAFIINKISAQIYWAPYMPFRGHEFLLIQC